MILAGPAAAENDAPRCEPSHVDSDIEPFGRVVTWRIGQEFRLPDFRLQVVAGATSHLEFRVRASNGADAELRVTPRPTGTEPLEFEFNGRRYMLETTHTVLYNRALAGNELVVWPRDEYHAERAKWTARATGNDS